MEWTSRTADLGSKDADWTCSLVPEAPLTSLPSGSRGSTHPGSGVGLERYLPFGFISSRPQDPRVVDLER